MMDDKKLSNDIEIRNKVSIIVPTYKRELKFISRAINSLLNQTYKNVEIIVIDDSPDSYELRPVIANYMYDLMKSDSRLHYVKNKENIGGGLSRNRGIDISSGRFITFLDDDDEYKPEKIEKQVFFMLENKYDMSFENMIMYNDLGLVVDKREYHDIKIFSNQYLLKYHLMHHMTGTPTFMYRASKLREIKGFDDVKMGQEFHLMLKTIESGLSIGYMDTCDVIVYKHSGDSVSNGTNKIVGENNLYEFKKQYFSILESKEIRFIKFRHYAVMVVAYVRNSMYFEAIKSAISAFVVSPYDFIVQVSKQFLKVIKHI